MLRPMRAKKTSGPVAMRDLTNCSREEVGRGRNVTVRWRKVEERCDGEAEKGRTGMMGGGRRKVDSTHDEICVTGKGERRPGQWP